MANVAPFTTATPYSLLPTSPTRGEYLTPASYHDKDSTPNISTNRRLSLIELVTMAPPRSRRTPTLLMILAGLVVVVVLSSKSKSSPIHHFTHGVDLQYNARGKIAIDFEATEVPPEWRCNPFKEQGHLEVDPVNPYGNYWVPYDEECTPSRLLEGLMSSLIAQRSGTPIVRHRNGPLRSHDSSRPAQQDDTSGLLYPWLQNATIVMQGDSMERLHLSDFCDMVGGNLTNITPKHPASPKTYRKPMPTILGPDGLETADSIRLKQERIAWEDHMENRENSWYFTRPWVCDLKEYNATLVNIFAWGLEDMEYAYQTEEFYHGPSTWLERFRFITVPMLKNLAVHFDRPQIEHPTMIELSAGFWDLRGMTEEDFISRGIPRPYPESDLAFGSIGEDREKRWVKHATEILQEVAKTFPGAHGVRDGPVITWRSLHHPKRNNYTPWSRAFALDQLGRKTIHDLRVNSLATHPTLFSSAKKAFLETKDRYFAAHGPTADSNVTPDIDYGFDERLRINEVGPLLLGQEHHFKDFLHPMPLPGSYLWADILIYEIKRAVGRVGRSFQ